MNNKMAIHIYQNKVSKQNRNIIIDTENILMAARWERGQGDEWKGEGIKNYKSGLWEVGGEIGRSRVHFPQQLVKHLEDLLRNKKNSQQYPNIYVDRRPKSVEDTEKTRW